MEEVGIYDRGNLFIHGVIIRSSRTTMIFLCLSFLNVLYPRSYLNFIPAHVLRSSRLLSLSLGMLMDLEKKTRTRGDI